MKTNWTIWLKAATIRAIKTAAQTACGVLATSALLSEVNWAVVGSSAAMAAIVSLLTSLAGLPEVKMQKRERLRINKNTTHENA